jgi:peptidyl-prolyl cis-trans isomerase C
MTAQATAQGCAVKPAIERTPGIVSVNSVVITRVAIAQEIQNHPASKPIAAWMAAASALAIRELLLQEGRRIGIAPEPLEDDDGRRETHEEALVRALVAAEVKIPEADDAVCRRYFEMNTQRFRSSDLYEVRHILLAAAQGDVELRVEARQQATVILEKLGQDASIFGELAATVSACPSGKVGGSLGQIGVGQTVPEFESALREFNAGDIDLIETRYGIHIVVLDRFIEGVVLPFEMVRERIAKWLNEKVQRQAIRQYISILAGRAEIIGIDLASSGSPLLQ